MNETENKNQPARTDEKASAKKSDEKKPAKKAAARKPQKQHHPLLVFMIILLLLVAGAGYGIWQYVYQQQAAVNVKLNIVDQELDKLQRAQRYQSDDQQIQLNKLEEQQQQLARNFASVMKRSAHLRNDWLLAEAEYLVKLANHRLLLENDINTAITALEAADERLKEVADPALLEVRKVFLEQVQALRGIEQPDVTGMALKLSALKKEIPALPMQTPDPATVMQREQQSSHAAKVESWKQLPAAMWEDLKSLVVIRDHSQAVQPLLPPEQHYFLIQNLNLQLEQARLALLRANNRLYIDSLATAKQWIENYFDNSQQVTRSVLASIEALSAKNIEPTIPDISNTFKVLQEYRLNAYVKEEAGPVKAAPETAEQQPAEQTGNEQTEPAAQP